MTIIKHSLAAFAAALLLVGCNHGSLEPSPYDVPVGYFVPEFHWTDYEAVGTEIHDLMFVVGGNGLSYTKHFYNTREAAQTSLALPVGESGVVYFANASEADGYYFEGLPDTKGADGVITLSSIGRPSRQIYGGRVCINMTENAERHANADLSPVVPALTMEIFNIPDDVTIQVVLDNMAKNIVLSPLGDKWATPGSEPFGSFNLGRLSSENSRVSQLVLPTVATAERTSITLTILQSDAPAIECKLYAPRIEVGRKYAVDLDFLDLATEMHANSFVINEWKSASDYSGHVF